MERMKLKNEQLVARRMRSEADENQYNEQEEARQVAQKEQRIKMKQKLEDDNRIQSAIEFTLQLGCANCIVVNATKCDKGRWERYLNGIKTNLLWMPMVRLFVD